MLRLGVAPRFSRPQREVIAPKLSQRRDICWCGQRLKCPKRRIRSCGVPVCVGVFGNISACHADAPGLIPGHGASFVVVVDVAVSGAHKRITLSTACAPSAAHTGFQNLENLGFDPSALSLRRRRASHCANTPELRPSTRVVQAAPIAFTSAPGLLVLCVLFLLVGLVRESK